MHRRFNGSPPHLEPQRRKIAQTDLDGEPRKLSEFRGKYLLVDIWATWCKPCVADIPLLKEAYAKYRTRGFEILGIDNEATGQDATATDVSEGLERIKAFISEKGLFTVYNFRSHTMKHTQLGRSGR